MNKILTIYFLDKKQNSNLIALALISVALMLLRVKLTHDIYLLFLIWNLFLGYLPYVLSSKLKTTVPGTFRFYAMLLGWILFLPNSFYLLTDFVHLHHNSSLQYVFDAITLTCFTIAGFYAGIVSLSDIHSLLEMKWIAPKCRLIIVGICYLSSFGVYLGRMLRFNSWDILSNPVSLFHNVIQSILNIETYLFTIILGTFILLVYAFSHSFLNPKTES